MLMKLFELFYGTLRMKSLCLHRGKPYVIYWQFLFKTFKLYSTTEKFYRADGWNHSITIWVLVQYTSHILPPLIIKIQLWSRCYLIWVMPGSERVRNPPKVTQLLHSWAGFEYGFPCFGDSYSLYCSSLLMAV